MIIIRNKWFKNPITLTKPMENQELMVKSNQEKNKNFASKTSLTFLNPRKRLINNPNKRNKNC